MVCIKFCGIRSVSSYNFCCSKRVDYIGINAVPFSKRYLSYDDSVYGYIQENRKKFYGEIVVVFVSPTIEDIEKYYKVFPFDIIQVYSLTEEVNTTKIREYFPNLKIWKAISLHENTNFQELENEINKEGDNSEAFLFDGAQPGSGTVLQFQNKKVHEFITRINKKGLPFVVAGGITADNIQNIREYFPDCLSLDTASGIESDGVFCENVASQILTNFRTKSC